MSKFTIGIQTTFVLILLSLYGQAAAQTSTDRSTHSLHIFSYSESAKDTNLEADEEEGMPERGQFLFRYRYTGEEIEPNITISHNGEFLASLNHLSPTAFDTLINVQIEKGDSLIYDFSFGISEEQIILHEELNSYSHGFWARGYSVQFFSEDAEGNVKHYGTMNFEYYLIPPFEGFVLLANPASIEQGEASALNFHAVELPDEPVIIPENTTVDMLLDENGSHLGGLLLPEFDPDNKYDGIFNFPYSVLTNTPVFYEADINPMKAGGHASIDAVSETVSIAVRSSHNWNILGITTLEVGEEGDEEEIEIIIASEEESVYPQQTGGDTSTGISVQVLKEGEPVSGFPLELMVNPVPNSGGHDHNRGRKTGKLRTFSGATDKNGAFSTTYESSEISGQEWVIATSNETISKDSILIRIEVPELHNFAVISSEVWRLTGNIGNTSYKKCSGAPILHSENHFAKQELIDKLQITLTQFFQWTKMTEDVGGHLTVGVNDISLPKGGLFDICSDWEPAHSSHRTGIDVDIDSRVFVFGTNQSLISGMMNTDSF